MADLGPYVDKLLKLVLRVFFNSNLLGNVGGGTTGLNFNAPLLASVNQQTQNVDVGLGSVNSLVFTPIATPSVPSSGWVAYSDSGDGNRLKAIASSGQITYLQGLTDGSTVYSGAFTAAMNTISPYNFPAAAIINFPAANAAMAGQSLAIVNVGTGATGASLFGQGTSVVLSPSGHASAAGPSSGQATRYTYSALINSWVPSI